MGMSASFVFGPIKSCIAHLEKRPESEEDPGFFVVRP